MIGFVRAEEIVRLIFRDRFQCFFQNIAIVQPDGQSFTYRELVGLVEGVLPRLREETLAFVVCNNTIGSVVAYLAAMEGGVIPLLLSEGILPQTFLALVGRYRPQYIIVPKARMSLVPEGYSELQSINDSVILRALTTYNWPIHGALAQLMSTSGTTGSPKQVRLARAGLTNNIGVVADYLGISPQDEVITTMPMNYAYGLSIILTHLICGATVVLNRATVFDRSFWELLNARPITTFGGVPYIFDTLKKLRIDKRDLSKLHYITHAGGGLNPTTFDYLVDFCQEQHINFVSMYGQTEASPRMAYLSPDLVRQKRMSIGKAVRGGTLSLETDKRAVITEPNTVGELVYRGPNVALGYAMSLDDLQKGDEFNGVLRTGDLAQRDDEGFYFVEGRVSRIVKLFGHRTNLDDVENLVRSYGHECAVVGVDDEICIFLAGPGNKQRLRRYLASETGINVVAYKVMTGIEIPYTATGKVDYGALQNIN